MTLPLISVGCALTEYQCALGRRAVLWRERRNFSEPRWNLWFARANSFSYIASSLVVYPEKFIESAGWVAELPAGLAAIIVATQCEVI
jgi:hypothetical protein